VALLEIDELQACERRGDWDALIDGLRDRVGGDRRTFTAPWVKEWVGRRWRNLFIARAAEDEAAVKVATRRLSLPGAKDTRPPRQKVAERFLHRGAEEWELELPPARHQHFEDITLVFCPGLVSTLLPIGAFEDAFPRVEERLGCRILRADAHPARGCVQNCEDIRIALERGEGRTADNSLIPPGTGTPPGDVILLGYSKGSSDFLTLLVSHPELADRVKAAVCWAGCVGGSYLANDVHGLLNTVAAAPPSVISDAIIAIFRALAPMVDPEGLRRLNEFEVIDAVRDLTTPERQRFLEEHSDTLDALGIPFFHVVAVTAPLEVPLFQLQGYVTIALRERENDMQVTKGHSRLDIPMATDLGYAHAHHWDVAIPPFPGGLPLGPNLDHQFPREAAVTATLQVLSELGLTA
jgi:hypothetical protein